MNHEIEPDNGIAKLRDTDLYKAQYDTDFVDKWDELIDWDGRAEGEGRFFTELLGLHQKNRVLDVATGTGYHSITLMKAGFDVHSADGSPEMLHKAAENGRKQGLVLRTIPADWRWLTRDVEQRYDAVICLGNSFTHLFSEPDRRKVLAEFYAVLKHDGILVIDQRNYDNMLDAGFSTKHRYYYAGNRVKAEPVHIAADLVVFEYRFPDNASYTLNMFPLRKEYFHRLIRDAGFRQITTYGDFREDYEAGSTDFFIHVAQKE